MTDAIPLLKAHIRVCHDEMVDEFGSHTVEDIRERYNPWIRKPIRTREGESFVVFEGATFVSQVEQEPNPKVRVALIDNDDPHPLISGARIEQCHPITPDWSVDSPNGVGPPTIHGFRVSYTTKTTSGKEAEEHARNQLSQDVREQFRYEVRDVTVQEDSVALDVYVPASDTSDLSVPRRLFPTAEQILPIKDSEVSEG